jgi:hypothetical protein
VSYYYHDYPPQRESFESGFSGCLGVGCAIVAVGFLGFLAMGLFIMIAVLES